VIPIPRTDSLGNHRRIHHRYATSLAPGWPVSPEGRRPPTPTFSQSATHIESRMFVVLSRSFWVGWTRLGGAIPLGGQAHMRSHRPERGVGGNRQVIMRTAQKRCVSQISGQAPPRSYVESIVLLYSLKGKGGSHQRKGPVGASQWCHQHPGPAIPLWNQGVQHRPHYRRATHPAGYERAIYICPSSSRHADGSGVL
jgi:hypothetical protein